MQNKLQELTDKLYQEGLSKGKLEGEELLEKARQEADALLLNARTQADSIREEAQKQAAEQHVNAMNELKMAAQQSVAKLKIAIEELVVAKTLQAPIHQALSDTDFVKTMIQTALAAFNPKSETPPTLSILLPAAMQKELDDFFKTQLHKKFADNLVVSFDAKQKSGFTISPKEGEYRIRFSEADFEALFAEYLRPKTKALLFS